MTASDLVSALTDLLTALVDALFDAVVWILSSLLSAVVAALSLLPTPDFLQGHYLVSLLNQLPPFALYCASRLGLSDAFAIILAGFSFRMGRKILTLFQW